MAYRGAVWRAALISTALAVSGRPAAGQDLEPRAYSASPVGTTFFVVAVGRTSGGVFTDPSLPFEDVEATLGAATVGIGHTFDLFSRTALIVGTVPYARGTASGRIEEERSEATRVGWADGRVKLSVNLFAGRALRPQEFRAVRRSTIVGVSLTTVLPLGQYHGNRLVNLGTNRWAFKPEAGVSIPAGRWTLDAYGGVWLFAANDDFYPGGVRREQDSIFALQGHVSYTLRPRLWAAFDATWYSGGVTTIGGVERDDRQRNSRVGATLSIPLRRTQSFKITYSTGATTRVGGDFNTIAIAWQTVWTH
jgi:outer membrane putative beta-barrel porin/alpha-amylase